MMPMVPCSQVAWSSFPLTGFLEGVASQTYGPAADVYAPLSTGNGTAMDGGGVRYAPPTREFTLARIGDQRKLIGIYRRKFGKNSDFRELSNTVHYYTRLIRELPPQERFAHFSEIARLAEPGRLTKWAILPKTRRENRASEEIVQKVVVRDASQLIPDLPPGRERLEALVVLDQFRRHPIEKVRSEAEFAIARYVGETEIQSFEPLNPHDFNDKSWRPSSRKKDVLARLAYSYGPRLPFPDMDFALRQAVREDWFPYRLHFLLEALNDHAAALPHFAPALGALFVLSGRMERILPTRNIDVFTDTVLDKMASDRALQSAILILIVSGESEEGIRAAALTLQGLIPKEARVTDYDDELLGLGDSVWKGKKSYGQLAIRLQPPSEDFSLAEFLKEVWDVNLQKFRLGGNRASNYQNDNLLK